jgi:imidazole glycerol-phosphate synthase subunit HisF
MLRPRIIPCLLIHNNGLVKTRQFASPTYVGDPINAVRIFNEKEADELFVLDIDATVMGKEPNYELIANLAEECRMPLCYGGGVNTASQAARIIDIGAEKVSISAAAVQDPSLLTRIAESIGTQSVVATIDVRRRTGLFSKGFDVCTRNATVTHRIDAVDLAISLQRAGAGEIVVNSVNLDGEMSGYDLDLAQRMREALDVPLTLLGGAGSFEDMSALIGRCGIVGAAAGSLFVFKGRYRAVLISYPTTYQKNEICRPLSSAYSK